MRHKGILPSGRIGHNDAEVTATFLAKYYPEFALQLDKEIKDKLPAFIFSDFNLIPDFLDYFCEFRGIQPTDITGHNIQPKLVEYRKEFLAVLMLCYHPEKLHNITQKRTWQGVEKKASDVLNCYASALANFIPQVISHFQHYKDFRETVTLAHQDILRRHQEHLVQGQRKAPKVRQYAGFTRSSSNQLSFFPA